MPILRCHTSNEAILKSKSLVMAVYDYDFEKSNDDEMGFAQLSLAALVEEPSKDFDFECPVIHNGITHGSLTGKVKLVWPDAEGRRAHRDGSLRGEECGCAIS